MKNERHKNRPQVEGLESMTLLSGASAMVAHVAAADVGGSPNIPVSQAIALNGTDHGFYVSHQKNPDTGTTYDLFASGKLTPVGRSFVTGSFQTPGFVLNGKAQGSLTVLAPHGTLNLKLTQIVPPPSAPTTASPIILLDEFSYTITGGTGRYRGANGSGTLDVTVTPAGSGATATSAFTGSGRATLDFHSSPTVTA